MKKKILTLSLVIALAAIAIIGMSLAYFTDKEEANNTFTVGKVGISLAEPDWTNNQVMMPGVYVEKNPTVTVDADSEDCYLFVEIDMARYVGYAQLIAEKAGKPMDQISVSELRGYIDEFIQGINHAEWEVMNVADIQAVLQGTTPPVHLKLVLGYKGSLGPVLNAGNQVTVFEKIGLPSWVTQDMAGHATLTMDGRNPIQLNIRAYAIQAAGFVDLLSAYGGLTNDISGIGAMS